MEHLTLHNFDPIVFDGRDPAAFAWAIFAMEDRLEAASTAVQAGNDRNPVRLPYGIAVAPKGAGFYNEGTNLAHNLPLMTNPHTDPASAEHFNTSARRLWVPIADLREAHQAFQHHTCSQRPKERDHPLAHRNVHLREAPAVHYHPVPTERRDAASWTWTTPMGAIDRGFLAMVQANPHLRPRAGNPDEMRSNRMQQTLDALCFRVTDPEPIIPEAIGGAVVTALNEEAVACTALGNKGGINIIVTYEAFGAKMHGALRQEIIFAHHCHEAGRLQRWLSIPLVLTSHTWENGKNEQSHQDPAMAKAMLGETSQVSRVVFPADYNTAAAVPAAAPWPRPRQRDGETPRPGPTPGRAGAPLPRGAAAPAPVAPLPRSAQGQRQSPGGSPRWAHRAQRGDGPATRPVRVRGPLATHAPWPGGGIRLALVRTLPQKALLSQPTLPGIIGRHRMGKVGVRGGAMPMFFLGRDVDHIPHRDLLLRGLGGNNPCSLSDEQAVQPLVLVYFLGGGQSERRRGASRGREA